MKETIDLARPWENTFSPVVSKLDIYYAFRHILGKLPEENEWHGHCGFVGKNLNDVVTTYFNSPEFKNRKLTGFSPRGSRRVELDGYAIYVAENDHAVGGHILANREYEPPVSEVFVSFLKPGMTAVDIGANIGWFSLLSAYLVGSRGRVFSFEPGAENSRYLLLNKLANGFEQITLIHAAASEQVESLAYNSSFSNGFVTNLNDAETGVILDANVVFALPVDLIVPIDLPVHLIKVDVEGWEMKALRGAERVVARWKPLVVVEFSPPALEGCSGVTGEEFLSYFEARGYRFNVIEKYGLLNCDSDVSRVMAAYTAAKANHIDLLLKHPGQFS